jgi:hypothetical protein
MKALKKLAARAGFLLALLILAGPATAQPQAEAAFTHDMAERMRAAVPGRRVVISGPLQVRVEDGEDGSTVNLDRIFAYCAAATPEECEVSRANYVAARADGLADASPIRREQLRIALRSSDWCETLRREAPALGITRPAAPGLCAVMMADYPNRMRVLAASDLGDLSIEPDAAWTLAVRQTLSELPEPDELTGLADGMAVVEGFDYAPSLLLDPAAWSRATARYPDLVVAVPGDEGLILVRRGNVRDMAGLADAVRENFRTAERGLSPLLYRWAGEWVVVE